MFFIQTQLTILYNEELILSAAFHHLFGIALAN